MSALILDFNDARPPGYFSPRQLDNPNYVPELKAMLEGQAESFLAWLWPNGRIVGKEFHIGSPAGEKGSSFKISLRREKVGVGCDFAGNVVTGDLIDCASLARFGHKARGRHFAEVVEDIERFLGMPYRPKPKAARAEPEDLGPPTGSWTYTDAAGKLLHIVRRYELPNGKKSFRQSPPMPDTGRPLYNLPGVAKATWVVFVEGEKSAQALIDKGICATCAMAGSKAPAEKTDWSPLAKKHVLVWPDADTPGREFAAAVRVAALEAGAAEAIVLDPPEGKTEGWDAADAIAEGFDVESYLSAAVPAQKQRPGRVLDIEAWTAAGFEGEPRPIQWCIDGVVPLGNAGLLVAMGDAGKGIATLDLALKIASPKPDGGVLDEYPTSLGGTVMATGAVVILAAEDDRETLHRRLHALDPDGQRFNPACRLYTVPLPNAGGPLPIVKTSSTLGPYVTDEWHELRARLMAIPDLRMVVLDPLASFVHADINADPAAGAFVTGLLASLATETGATVLLPHHMAKRQTPVNSPEEARAAIRGSTAIVDGVRFAYALWHTEESEGQRICRALGEEWARNRVLKGAVVKSNAPADLTVRVYVRDMSNGLLVDRTTTIASNRGLQRELELDTLCNAIVDSAARGYPYAYSGSAGIYERRSELPPAFHAMGRDRIRALVDKLMFAGRIARVRHKGQSSPWLDAPDGDFSRGLVELSIGANV